MNTQLGLFDDCTGNSPVLRRLEQLQELTPSDTVPGVYCWYIRNAEPTDDFTPMYIGQSKNIWKRWLKHRQMLNKVSARMTPFTPQEIIGSRIWPYALAVNILLQQKYNPPFEAIAKILERSTTNQKTLLMERERYFIKLFQTESKGFNQPLILEWHHGMKANQNNKKYWLTFLELGGSSLDILYMCPFDEIVKPTLLDYLRKERTDYIKRYTEMTITSTRFAQILKAQALTSAKVSQYLEKRLEHISTKRTENNISPITHTPEIEKIIRGSP